MFKISFHSVCDLITNSSTVIFSWYDGSVKACKELVAEMLRVFGVDKKPEDLFYIGAFLDDWYDWLDYLDKENLPAEVIGMTYEEAEEFQRKILRGEIEKPLWMVDLEERANDYDHYRDISFYLEPKDLQYEELGKKLEAFLYSPDHQDAYK